MFRHPTVNEKIFIALFLEGFLCGFYTGIFFMYLQYKASKQGTSKTQSILFYSMCALYVMSVSVFVFDVAVCICDIFHFIGGSHITGMFITQTILFACCDFIAQLILIYRCWIVWNRNIYIVIIPSMLSLAFLVLWIVGDGPTAQIGGGTGSLHSINLIGLALSLTVNTLVTGLIVFKILKVFRQVRATSEDKMLLGAAGGTTLRRIIVALIESAMALFSIQFARLMVYIVGREPADNRIYSVIVVTHQMLNGITPTIILMRTSMGLSFHDEKSMEEFAVGSLRFASNHPNSAPEMGSMGIVGWQDIGEDDNIDVQRSNNIDVVER